MFNGDRVSVLQNEDVPETDGGDGCVTLGMALSLLNYLLKNGEDGKFYVMCILLQIKQNKTKKKSQTPLQPW